MERFAAGSETGSADLPLDRQEPYLRVHAINIFVHDVDRSLDFYQKQLGFDVAFDSLLPSGERFVAVSPPDGLTVLRLIAPAPDSEHTKLIGRPTQVVFLTEDVLAKFREWSQRGVRFRYMPRLKRIRYERRTPELPSPKPPAGGEAPVWGAVVTRFEDLDGNSFTLVGFDEVSRQLDAHRRAIREKLEAERRAAQELDIARQVQARLFPQDLPRMSTLDYAGICSQARAVGGDYYDFLNLGRQSLGLVLGDIAGKGIAAALLMANLQANLRSQCAFALSHPQQFLASVNQLFYANTTPSTYATLFFAAYDDTTRCLRYSNCGHLPALLLRSNNTLERLGSTATVLGLFEDWCCSTEECRMDPGDLLVLYTDGVTESFDEQGNEFGEHGLVETLYRHAGLPPQSLVHTILDDVRRFSPNEQHDDITLIVARCGEAVVGS